MHCRYCSSPKHLPKRKSVGSLNGPADNVFRRFTAKHGATLQLNIVTDVERLIWTGPIAKILYHGRIELVSNMRWKVVLQELSNARIPTVRFMVRRS